MILYNEKGIFREDTYRLEEDFEQDVFKHAKSLFGNRTILINAKRKISSKAIGGTIPDGFLFDLSDKKNPEFYIIEVELANHDFYRHIFPQITKFFAFFKNTRSQADLIEKIYSIVTTDEILRKEFKHFIGEKELYKFIKDTIENSQNILLIIDELKKEIPEIIDTYTDTWGKIVKLMIVKRFRYRDEFLFSIDPEFKDLEYSTIESFDKDDEVLITEEFHLEGIQENTKTLYKQLKEKLLQEESTLKFNPRKYYIGIQHEKNIAFLKFRKKKLNIVVMHPYEEVIQVLPKSKVRQLGESVQKFWNGASCEIQLENETILHKVVELILKSIKEI